jgi:branched-chain amino acid transport system ATP-binding protein
MFLKIENLSASYGLKRVLFDISLSIGEKEIVAIIGPNGAGKTTTLRSIFGIHRQREGEVVFDDQDISGNSCFRNLLSGICYVPQGGRVFGNLSVAENLIMGGHILKDRNEKREKLETVSSLFPILGERKRQLASTLSGGERQMLAMGMSMMLTPRVLLLDEPSIGLAPALVPKLMEAIKNINRNFGTSVLIVEQNARQVLKISDRVYVMKVGRITDVDKPEKFLSRDELRKVYLSEVREDGTKGGEGEA